MPISPIDKRQILQNLHDAAGIGDVETVQDIFDTYHDELDVNVYRKGGNTALHTALYHSQEGMLIDYLIRSGANVNGLNSKGFSPLLVAVIRYVRSVFSCVVFVGVTKNNFVLSESLVFSFIIVDFSIETSL